MWARRDAQPISATFPVLIYAAGDGGTAHENADLCEYLASHGYVVIASRNMGTRTRDLNADLEGIDTQARDITFLISYARTLPQADMTQIAAAGFSWGGMSNVLAAVRDSRISALVSLDGTREPEYTKRISPAQVALPWPYISRRPDTIPELNKRGIETSFSLLNALKFSDVYQVALYPVDHMDFSSPELRLALPSNFTEYSRTEVEQAYHWTARYVLEFLNVHLKRDASGQAFLGRLPVKNGVPPHMAMVQHTPAQAEAPSTRAGFAAELAKRGFEHAPEIYRAMHQRDPAFALSERDLNLWGYQLMARANHLNAAIDMFNFGVATYPNDANLFDSLGDAYERKNDKASAIASYRRSIELNPKNDNAIQRLKALQ